MEELKIRIVIYGGEIYPLYVVKSGYFVAKNKADAIRKFEEILEEVRFRR